MCPPESPPAPATGALHVTPLPAFRDNYIWLLEKAGRAAVVDPGDAAPVLQALRERSLALEAIVVTHHHADHVGGVAEIVRATGARVLAPAASPFRQHDVALSGGDTATVLGDPYEVLAVPGHTLDHIAYWSAAHGVLFCGDTLFACGCGRLFEGTAAQMHASLAALAALPPATRVYCAHEYTAANIRFALAVEPRNPALVARNVQCTAMRARGEPTVPSTLALERDTNPFLRCDQPSVRAAVRERGIPDGARAVEVFAALRTWKDGFQG